MLTIVLQFSTCMVEVATGKTQSSCPRLCVSYYARARVRAIAVADLGEGFRGSEPPPPSALEITMQIG